jgi:hypothetical protein
MHVNEMTTSRFEIRDEKVEDLLTEKGSFKTGAPSSKTLHGLARNTDGRTAVEGAAKLKS